MKTAMQEMLINIESIINKTTDKEQLYMLTSLEVCAMVFLEREKEQIQKAFSDGQETHINNPTIPHYSREEYYNDNYNQNK